MSSASPQKTLGQKSEGFTFTGWHMLFLMVAFFGTIITVNMILVFRAVGSYPGVDTEQSYRQGLAYNDTLEARAQQRRLEWNADVSVTAERKIILILTDKNNLPVRGLTVVGLLKHPTTTELDVELRFTHNAQTGQYEAQLSQDLVGKKWLLTKAVYANANSNTKTGTPVFETRNELWLK